MSTSPLQENRPYEFPEKDPHYAFAVTDPLFRIEEEKDWQRTLYVDLGRGKQFFNDLDFGLGLKDGKLRRSNSNFQKVIFSGHTGCGKSIELHRFMEKINHPDAYFVVMVDLEKETDHQSLAAEDFMVAIIAILVRELTQRGVPFEKDDFAAIADEWMSDKENVKEISRDYQWGAEAGVSLGWKFWEFLGIGGNLKGGYARSNKTTHIVRTRIKSNAKPLLAKFNAALIALRKSLVKAGKGKDILIIVDGLEKTNKDFYRSLFVLDAQFVEGIGAHLITTAPISTFYEIESQISRDRFYSYNLPMMRLDEENRKLLKAMLLRRVDEGFFGKGVMHRMIDMSGGCPRQLLRLAHRSIAAVQGNKIDLESLERVIAEDGAGRWWALTQQHRDLLKAGLFDTADEHVRELLLSLNLLEYNGSERERKPNPLIEKYLKETK